MSTTSTNASTEPIGVLYVNLGTPASPSVPDVRRFLRQFLSDIRVVDVTPVVWWPLLNVVILPLRARKSAHAYQSIWTKDGSPLMVISKRQAELLQRELGSGYVVELAMRYGEPSIASAVARLRSRGAGRMIVLTAFPQYSRATVGSVNAEVERVLASDARPLATTYIESWHDDPGFIDALAERCRASEGSTPIEHWVWSFHGLPERYVTDGDPYRIQCERTAELLAERLGLGRDEWSIAFQSRFGREAWLQPYADQLVPGLAPKHPRLGIATPAFAADCLETLEEIGIRLRATFLAAGGRELVLAPCVNDSSKLIAALARRVRES